jgi:tetratricopeptide (TPR) repeat protein
MVAAEQHFRSSLLAQDVSLQEKAYYNLGNTAYRNGLIATNAQEKLAIWGLAVGHFQSALKLQENDEDARFNLDVVQWHIDDLKARLEAARLAKLRSEEEVSQRRYQSALQIIEQQYQRDPTNTPYESYIQRLQQINQITNPPAP